MKTSLLFVGLVSGLLLAAGCIGDSPLKEPINLNPDSSSAESSSSSPSSPESSSSGSSSPAPSSSGSSSPATAEPEPPPSQLSSDSASGMFPGLSKVKWLHTDVSGWPQTAKLNVSFSGDSIRLNYDKANVWPAKSVSGTLVNANPWIFVERGGVWYAATWEWLRPGQTSKPKSVVEGGHIKVSPLSNFRPKRGEVYGFMVSGLARNSIRNVKERSNVQLVVWP